MIIPLPFLSPEQKIKIHSRNAKGHFSRALAIGKRHELDNNTTPLLNETVHRKGKE